MNSQLQTIAQNSQQQSAIASMAIKGIGIAIGALSFDKFKDLAKNALEFGDTLAETSQKLGISAVALQRLQYEGQLLNTDTAGMTKAFESFNNVLGLSESGSSKAQKLMGTLGTEFNNVAKSGASTDQVFMAALKALSQYTDQAQGAAIANKIFGDSGADIYTALRNGEPFDVIAAKVQNLSVVSNEQAAQASELNDKWDQMATGLQTQVTAAFIDLAPHIFKVVQALADGTSAAIKFFGALADGHSLMGSIALASGELTKQQVITQDLADATDKLTKAKKNLDSQGANSAARAASEQLVKQQQAEVDAKYKQLEMMKKAEEDLAKTVNKLNSPSAPGKPVGATGLGKEEGSGGHIAKAHKAIADTAKKATEQLEKYHQVMNNIANDVKYLSMSEKQVAQEKEYASALKSAGIELDKMNDVQKQEAENIQKAVDAKYKHIEATRIQQAQWDQLVKDANDKKDLMQELDDLANSMLDSNGLSQGLAKIDDARKSGLITDAEAARQQSILGQEFNKSEPYVKESMSKMSAFADEAARNIQDSFAQFLFDPFKDGLGGMLKGFGDMIRKMLAEAAAARLAEALFGQTGKKDGGGILGTILSAGVSAIGGYMGSGGAKYGSGVSGGNSAGFSDSIANAFKANGGAYDRGVEFFASGGIFDKPTMFGHSGGLGVMGEAGPEAIMPLNRDGSGKLGVRVSGNSSKSVSQTNIINVTVQGTNDPAEDGRRAGEAAIRIIAQQEIAKSIRPGNALNRNTNF